MPAYPDLHITTKNIPRTSIFDLPYDIKVLCARVSGWEVWDWEEATLIAGEYGPAGLRLDVLGYVICDSLTEKEHVVG